MPGRLLSGPLKEALRSGRYEHLEARALNRHLRPDDRVLDLGAGCGFLLIIAARIVGAGNVTAVEANPELIDVIRRNAKANDMAGIEVRHAAAGAENGTATFFERAGFWAGSTDRRRPQESGIEVPSLAFDALVSETDASVIMMDIEGGETALFETRVLGCVRMIVIELHPNRYGQDAIRTLFDRLSSSGFGYQPEGSRGKVVVFARPVRR